MRVEGHIHARKVVELLTKKGIPIEGSDKWGNPFVKAEWLPKLPVNLKPTLEKKGCHRICLKLYKQ